MDNRFGLKDAVMLVLMVAVLVSIWLQTVANDRQWESMRASQDALKEMTQSVQRMETSLRRLQQSGIAVQGQGGAATNADSVFADSDALRAKPDFAEGDWAIGEFQTILNKLTPLVDADYYQRVPEGYVIETLVTLNTETLEYEPWVATDWTISKDGLTYTYNLRQDVVFSDGEPLTSEDVVFSYNMINDPEINCPALKTYYTMVESVEADGPYRVVFKLNKPYFLGLDFTGGMLILAEHYYSQFTPEQFNTMPGLLFGSGPYKLEGDPKDWQPGDGAITLVRNELFWGPRPALNQLVWKQITDNTARLQSFENGETDMYRIPSNEYATLKEKKELLDQGNVYEVPKIDGGYSYIGWNQERSGQATLFADKRVRQAMTMLVNRPKILKEVLNNLGTVATGPFHPEVGQADAGIEPWAYDPERAKALLKEAGFEDRDGDGVLESPDGKPFRFKLIYYAANATSKQMVEQIKASMAQAGVVLEMDPTEWNTMLDKVDSRDFDAITLAWGGSIETDPRQIFHSSEAKGGNNYVGYKNPELDALIETARFTPDAAKRTEMWHQVHQILHDDQPYTFLFTRVVPMAVSKRFENVKPVGVGINEGMNDFTQWYSPAGRQRYTQ